MEEPYAPEGSKNALLLNPRRDTNVLDGIRNLSWLELPRSYVIVITIFTLVAEVLVGETRGPQRLELIEVILEAVECKALDFLICSENLP